MDQISLIEGVILTKLITIESPEGNVLRYLRHNDNGFNQFKESRLNLKKRRKECLLLLLHKTTNQNGLEV